MPLSPKLLKVCVAVAISVAIGKMAFAGTTISAQSCSQSAVQTAINAAATGDTVKVPAGTCKWTVPVIVPDTKRLVIQGAGIGATNITVQVLNALTLGTSDSDVFGFSFVTAGADEVIYARGDGGWRIHNNSFTNTSTSNRVCVYATGGTGIPHPIGLIDHNAFNNCRVLVYGDLELARGTIWSQPTGWGTFNAVYVEDNTFTYTQEGNQIDAQFSGRYVLRFNTIRGTSSEAHSAQNGHAARSWEIYGNSYEARSNQYMATLLRGGTGIVFNNTFSSGFDVTINLDNVRVFTSYGGIWTLCNGTSPIDGNRGSGSSAGWPCRDQIGRGKDSSLFVSGQLPYPTQASEPTPIFLNRTAGTKSVVTVNNGTTAYLTDCRDFQNESSSFTGSCGTGVGLLSARPLTCTVGVYYWATDQGEWNSLHSGPDGQLYKCTATNSWSLYYTPYPYPHPLIVPPPSPRNLRLISQ